MSLSSSDGHGCTDPVGRRKDVTTWASSGVTDTGTVCEGTSTPEPSVREQVKRGALGSVQPTRYRREPGSLPVSPRPTPPAPTDDRWSDPTVPCLESSRWRTVTACPVLHLNRLRQRGSALRVTDGSPPHRRCGRRGPTKSHLCLGRSRVFDPGVVPVESEYPTSR